MKHDSGQLRHDRSLPVTPTDPHTEFLTDWDSEKIAPLNVLDLITAIGELGWIGSKTGLSRRP